MVSQTVFIFVAVGLVQAISAQYRYSGNSCGCNAAPAISGGDFIVTSSSPIAPTGVSLAADISYEGCLSANGQLPFLGTVGFEGSLPTSGQAAVNYGCGSSNVGITSQGPSAASSYSGSSCGCGGYY